MRGTTRFLAAAACGIALLVGGLGAPASAGRNVVSDLGILTDSPVCQVTSIVVTSRVPSTATARIELYWWDEGAETLLDSAEVSPSTDLRSFTTTTQLSGPAFYNTLHVKVTVFKPAKRGTSVEIGSAETPASDLASINCV